MGTKRVNFFRMKATHIPRERIAASMPLQCDLFEGIRIVPMLLDVPTLKRNKFRDPRFKVTRRVKFRKETSHEPCHDTGRAALPRRLDLKAAQQRSPTRKWFIVTRCVNFFRMKATHIPRERCAAFMPLQCDLFEGIRIVSMILDVPTLKRNKFRDPRFKVTRRVNLRKETSHEPCHDIGRAALPRRDSWPLSQKNWRSMQPARNHFT